MVRRVTTLVLLPAVLLSQWVGACRCLSGCEAGGPDRRPHVHLEALLPGQPEKPSGGCSCRRQATTTPIEAVGDAPVVSVTRPAGTVPGHGPDDRVLYLSFDVCVGLPAALGDGIGGDLTGLPETLEPADHTAPGPAVNWHPSTHPPHDRPLYLLTRSLLI